MNDLSKSRKLSLQCITEAVPASLPCDLHTIREANRVAATLENTQISSTTTPFRPDCKNSHSNPGVFEPGLGG